MVTNNPSLIIEANKLRSQNFLPYILILNVENKYALIKALIKTANALPISFFNIVPRQPYNAREMTKNLARVRIKSN